MKKAASKLINVVKKHKFISVVIGFVVILLTWWIVNGFMSHPLGNEMTYLGKKDYGGPFGDSNPASTYYYGTEMNSNEIQNYFKNAKYSGTEGQTIGENYSSTVFDFTSPKGNFKISYYNNNNIFSAPNIKHSHTVSVESYDYSAANAAIR